MGCTSSAPNMADVQSNATDNQTEKSNGIEDTTNIRKLENNINLENQKNVEVLPPCDNNVKNNINVGSNCDRTELEANAGCAAKVVMEDLSINYEMPGKDIADEEKITTFKEVADKVLEEIHTEEVKEIDVKDQPKHEPINEMPEEIIAEPLNTESITEDDNVIENIEENTENKEHVSPSQSECSRSTRWEALADIAAELPPSLAVDPVTGQIYSLAK